MKALVTGIAGFIGSHLADRLLSMGCDVVGVDDLSAGYMQNVPEGVTFYKCSVLHVGRYMHELRDCDVIFHNAAAKKNVCLKSPEKDLMVNGKETLRLLSVAHKANPHIKFVHASTGSVYGEVSGIITEETPCKPVSYYGISKLAGENYVRLYNEMHGMDTTILRLFHVYGPRQESDPFLGGVIAVFADRIRKGLPVVVHGDGSQNRLFTYVDDVAQANIVAAMNPAMSGEIYNVANDVQVTVMEAAEQLMVREGQFVPIEYADTLIGDIYNFNIDSSKIQKFVKFTSFYDVLKDKKIQL